MSVLAPTNITSRVTVPTTAGGIIIVPARNPRISVVIQNIGTNDIYLGPATTVTTSGSTTGILLKGGQTPPLTLTDSISTSAWWGIASGGSSDVLVVETY